MNVTRRVSRRGLAIGILLLWIGWAHGATIPFLQRLDSLASAILEPGTRFSDRPLTHAKVAWLYLDADRVADALVFLRKDGSDCAARFDAAVAPCLGMLFLGDAQGRYHAVLRFPYFGQPVYFSRLQPSGRVLFLSDKNLTNALYNRYELNGRRFSLTQEGRTFADFSVDAYLVLTDRMTDTLEQQKYAANNFPNEQAALAPASIHLDAINARYVSDPKQYVEIARAAQEALVRDLRALSSKLVWTTPLNVRLWVCKDWVVLRRFWEVEDNTTNDVGSCLDPIVHWSFGWKPTERTTAMDAMRLRMLQDIAAAMLLRGEVVPVNTLSEMKRAAEKSTNAEIVFAASVMATAMAADLRLLSIKQMTVLQAAWQDLAQWWFEWFEVEQAGWIYPSAELISFSQDLALRMEGIHCASVALAKMRPGGAESDPTPNGSKDACKAERLKDATHYLELLKGLYAS